MKVKITSGELTMEAELYDTPTARQVWESLPVEGAASRWGEEVYFEIPVTASLEPDARAEVQVGELGYWPLGRALCIFFGPTPASTDERPRAYSPVNILGKVHGDATQFRAVRSGDLVRVERAD